MKVNRTLLSFGTLACMLLFAFTQPHTAMPTLDLTTNVFLNDNFDDGDLTGWTNTADWVNNGTQLQHGLSGTAGASSINYPYAAALDLTAEMYQWDFCLGDGGFDPSGGNNFVVHLNNTAAAGTGNGYAVGVNQSGTSDLLTLYRYDAGAPTDLVVSAFNWEENDEVCITVTRTATGDWELLYNPGTGQTSGGTVNDVTYTGGDFFGINFTFTSTRAGLLYADNISVQSCPAATMISFAAGSAVVSEDGVSYDICADITAESSTTDATVEVALTAGDASLIGDFTTQTLTFPAGSTAQQCVTVTLNDDTGCNGNLDFNFALQNPTGGMMTQLGTVTAFDLTVTDDELTTSVLVAQDFEGAATDTWTVTETPAAYNVSGDVWGIVSDLGGIAAPATGTMFWGMQDLENDNGGNMTGEVSTLTFDPVDVSMTFNNLVSFDYNVIGYDTGDNLSYEVFFDGTGQGSVDLIVGGDNATTNGWETAVIPVPDAVGNVALVITAAQNGGGDQAGVDNFQVTGQQCACTADAGDLTTNLAPTDFTVCVGEDLTGTDDVSVAFTADYTAADENDPGSLGTEYLFLLANEDGTLVEVSVTGDFDFSVLSNAGVYSVFGLSYAVANMPNIVAAYINAIVGDADSNDIAQIQTDQAGGILCLDLNGNDAAGMPLTVTVSDGPAVSDITGTNPTLCTSDNGSITIELTDPTAAAADYTVAYQMNGTPFSLTVTSTESTAGSGMFDVLLLENVGAGDYDNFVLTSQSSGCSLAATQTVTLTAPGAVMPTIVTSADPTTCGGNEGTITIGNLTAGLMYTVNYMRDGLNVTGGPFIADADGEITVINLIAADYNGISVTESVSGCSGGNLNTTLVDPDNPVINSPGTVTVCAPDAAAYDLTQNEAAVTTDAGTFTYFFGDPDNGGTQVTDPTMTAVADGETYFIVFTDDVTACSATTMLSISVFSEVVITTQPAECGDATLTYTAAFSVMTNTDDAVTAVGSNGTDYTANLLTADDENYTIDGIPNDVDLTITVTREDNTCPPATEMITGINCCLADAGDLLPPGAQEICEGDDSPAFMTDYSAADETDPNPALPVGLMISEIRNDQPQSGDPDEFFEIYGTPGTSLDDFTFLVIGDGAGGSGVIENVTDLTGQTIPASGYFVAAMSGFTLATADLTVADLNFENGDNVTYLLVQNFTGDNGDDLDTDDDGTLDVTPWTSIIDDVAALETVGSGDLVYSSTTVGPNGTFVPAHFYFSAENDTYLVGEFDPTDPTAVDTPGEANEMPPYITLWIAAQDNSADGGTTTDIFTVQAGANNPPYGTTFSGLPAGEYCVHGVNFGGTEAEFTANGFTTVQAIADAVAAGTICADLDLAACIPLTVTDALTVTMIAEGDCTSEDASGTFTVSFNIAGGVAPITVNSEDVTDPAFSQGTITGSGTDADPYIFTSNDIASNTAYSYTVADASALCGADVTVAGIKDCDPCTGFAAADAIDDTVECADATITLTPAGGGKQVAVTPTDLFISEYIEGSSNNKCLEIYNGTGADIDLAAATYEIMIFANGSTSATGSIALSGILADGDVYVICNNQATSDFTDEADLTSSQLNYNGDDAVVLMKGGSFLDIFGNIGCDPGSQWVTGGNTTQNMTLVRNANVFAGVMSNPTNPPCEFPTLADEWTGFVVDETAQLGGHTFSGMTDLTVSYNFYDTDPTGGGETPIASGEELEITDAIVPADGTPTTLFITAFSTDPACESDPIDVVITRNPLPAAMNAALFKCMNTDGTGNFTLEEADAQVSTDADVTISYYATEENADTATDPLTSPYNAADGTVVFARVEDTDTCIAVAEVTLNTTDCEIGIADPCTCRDNPAAPGISGNATTDSDGQFNETVTVTDAPSGQTFYIQSVVGLFDDMSAQPPNAPTPFVTGPAGETLVEMPNGDGTSDYTLQGLHIEGQGYSITVTNGTEELSISNQCFYPTLALASAPDEACLFTEPFTITGAEVNGGVAVTAMMTVFDDSNAVVQTEAGQEITIDPMELGTGIYTVSFNFDAGAAGSMDISDPGCEFTITESFQIVETPSQLSCNNNINISVGADCMTEITPDMILEGSQSCEDDYEVQILTNQGQNLGNTTTPAMIGNSYNVRVFHLPTNNFCWGSISINDLIAPTIDCPTAAIQIDCFEDFNAVPVPTATDNCSGSVAVQQTDENIGSSDPCSPTVVTRTYIAIDGSGNQSAVCQQTINLVSPDLPDFPEDITFTCEQYAAFPGIVDAEPLNPAITDSDPSDADIDVAATTPNGVLLNTGAGIPDVATGIYCQYGLTSDDNILTTCGDNFKIIRTFVVLNWCTNTVVTEDINGDDNVQVIKITDATAPTLSRAGFTVSANVFGTGSQPCRSQAFLLPATVTDNCSNIAEIRIFTPVGEATYTGGNLGANGGFIPAPGLMLGTHTITYTATDECGNVQSIDVTIEVVDDQSPTMVCDEITTTVLGSNGLATINAATFDDGSNDNCGIDEFMVRRMTDPCGIPGNTTYGPSVTFCCIDAAQGSVQVQLQAVDFFGNTNSCMVQVIVEDNNAPTQVSCPPAQTITCEFFNENLAAPLELGQIEVLSQFGTAEFDDPCLPETTEEFFVDTDNCGEGTITRIFNATDAFGNAAPQCTQTINVIHVSNFVVEFPADIDLECAPGENPTQDGDFGEPNIFFDDCEMVATSFDDQVFTITDDACYKIFRTWTVINWCVYDDFGFDAVIESPEADLPGGSLDPDGDKDNRTFRDGLNEGNFPNAQPDGYIQYVQVIKVQDNVAPVILNAANLDVCITENVCATTVNIPAGQASDCSPDVTFTVSGDLGTGFTFNDVGPGTYNMVYIAEDNCGNVSSAPFTVTVTDCKAPTPYCLSGLVIELSPIDTDGDGDPDEGFVEIWANDFDAGSFDNCTENVLFSFSPDAIVQGATYDCDSIGQRAVYLWVTDAVGNQDVCQTSVFIESVDNVCGGESPAIAGFVEREDGEGVMLSEVMISGNGSNTDMTNNEGYFEVTDLEAGYDYTVVPSKNDDHNLGVTTLDIIKIRQHILTTELLDSPYKLIAADANNNQMVTTSDIIEIRRLILTTITEFSNNTSWRFVDKYFSFPDPQNPWATQFPEFQSYNNLDVPVFAADFIGIKIGDVNNSAVINLTGEDDGEERNAGTFALRMQDRVLRAGQTVSVPVYAGEDVSLLGMQWTLEYDSDMLKLAEIEPRNPLKKENFGVSLREYGIINHSFDNVSIESLNAGEELFVLTFTAQADGYLSDWLKMSDRHIKSEAYLSMTDIAEVILEFDSAEDLAQSEEIILFQNKPNPFSAGTEIAFYLPVAQTATLTIYDAAGKVLSRVRADYPNGKNSVEYRAEDLPAVGLLYYRLETDSAVLTRKMIKQ